jgi:hypothetical protein
MSILLYCTFKRLGQGGGLGVNLLLLSALVYCWGYRVNFGDEKQTNFICSIFSNVNDSKQLKSQIIKNQSQNFSYFPSSDWCWSGTADAKLNAASQSLPSGLKIN